MENLDNTIIHLIFQSAALAITAGLIPGLRITSIFGPVLMVVSLTAFNSFYWDADLFYTIPQAVTLETAGLFLVNGVIFWILVKILPGIEIDGLFPAIAAPLIFSGMSVLVNTYGNDVNWPLLMNKIKVFMNSLKDSFAEQANSIQQ